MTEADLLMSYGASAPDMFRQIGAYTAKILKKAKPTGLPVVQSTKFETRHQSYDRPGAWR
jgi:ABC-type uncharacterized transport system substrate-binding protein